MCSWLVKKGLACLCPWRYDDEVLEDDYDKLIWSRDLEKHSHGEFSFALVQANKVLEDQSQVETGQHATVVGVYDGHGGAEASKYIRENFIHHLLERAQENGTMSEDAIRNSFSDMENGFLTYVRRAYQYKPAIATVGSCCLVGVFWKDTLFVANLGDSRAVMGYLDRSNKIVAEQLTRDHNACMEEVREELRTLHPEDSEILVMKNGIWLIKGIIQVSRSIGDAFLKRPEFVRDKSFPKFCLPDPLRPPVLSADPTICARDLKPNEKFVIFASDGLWEHLSNQDAIEIVYNNPRVGIARRLLISAMEKAANTRNMTYDEVKKLGPGNRRHIHDDITIVVVFIDGRTSAPDLSIQGFVDTVGPTNLNFLP